MAIRIPSEWPPGLVYLQSPSYSRNLVAAQVDAIQPNDEHHDMMVCNLAVAHVKIRKISDGDHPAYGQHGLFTTRHLEAGAFILPYFGYVHPEHETNLASDYDLSLDRDTGVGVDAAAMGNEARFVNDYRGVLNAGAPNAGFKDVWIRTAAGKVHKCIGIFVLPAGESGKGKAGIRKGSEILVSYGKGFWTDRMPDKRGERSKENDVCDM